MQFVVDTEKSVNICFNTASGMDCMQLEICRPRDYSSRCFNTASGMDCMQFEMIKLFQTVEEFQYRKRYGLHAIADLLAD